MKKKSIFGSVDLLHGPILPALIMFMIPIFVSYLFQQLYNAVDTALVGNILGTTSLAAVGSCALVPVLRSLWPVPSDPAMKRK